MSGPPHPHVLCGVPLCVKTCVSSGRLSGFKSTYPATLPPHTTLLQSLVAPNSPIILLQPPPPKKKKMSDKRLVLLVFCTLPADLDALVSMEVALVFPSSSPGVSDWSKSAGETQKTCGRHAGVRSDCVPSASG